MSCHVAAPLGPFNIVKMKALLTIVFDRATIYIYNIYSQLSISESSRYIIELVYSGNVSTDQGKVQTSSHPATNN